jgi:hypothetical protein
MLIPQYDSERGKLLIDEELALAMLQSSVNGHNTPPIITSQQEHAFIEGRDTPPLLTSSRSTSRQPSLQEFDAQLLPRITKPITSSQEQQQEQQQQQQQSSSISASQSSSRQSSSLQQVSLPPSRQISLPLEYQQKGLTPPIIAPSQQQHHHQQQQQQQQQQNQPPPLPTSRQLSFDYPESAAQSRHPSLVAHDDVHELNSSMTYKGDSLNTSFGSHVEAHLSEDGFVLPPVPPPHAWDGDDRPRVKEGALLRKVSHVCDMS